jgi:septum formation protein
MTALVLASASAARAKLLEAAGIIATRDPAALDEAAIKADCRRRGDDAEICAATLAEAKARAVTPRHRGALVLGADQMLECEGRWFDKPRDRADARGQLRALAGREHVLVTAAALARGDEILWRAVERPRLTMRACSEPFLDTYLDRMGARALDTVGAYELEGLGIQLMARVEGDYFAILGLPLLSLLAFLRAQGVLPS